MFYFTCDRSFTNVIFVVYGRCKLQLRVLRCGAQNTYSSADVNQVSDLRRVALNSSNWIIEFIPEAVYP